MRIPVAKDKETYKLLWYNAQGFGVKTSYGFHEGDDYNLRTGGNTDLGQSVYAIADGVVSSLHEHTTKPTFGKHIHIKHDGPWGTVWSHYAHLMEVFVVVGQEVKEGQKIATLGNSGTDWAHLHFAIKNQPTGIDGIAKTKEDLLKWIDPLPFIEKWEEVDQMTDDQKRALQILEETRSNNLLGNLEGAARAGAGAISDLARKIARITELEENLTSTSKRVSELEEQLTVLKTQTEQLKNTYDTTIKEIKENCQSVLESAKTQIIKKAKTSELLYEVITRFLPILDKHSQNEGGDK